MSVPVCSIVIPTFNCREYLPIALHSIAMQNVGPLEILILDDGSTDGSWEYLRLAKEIFPEMVVIKACNVGPSEARNILISIAKSELIAFLDADDYWWPGKLKSQIAYHQANPEIAFSFSNYLHIDMNGVTHGTAFDYWKPRFATLKSASYRPIEQPLAMLLGCNTVGTSTVMARKNALQNAKGFAKDMPSAEDWDLWLRMAEHGGVACSGAITMSYLQRPGSLTANREARLAAINAIIARYQGRKDGMLPAATKQAMSRYYVAQGEHFRAQDEFAKAAKSHLSAFLKCPSVRDARAAASDIHRAYARKAQGLFRGFASS